MSIGQPDDPRKFRSATTLQKEEAVTKDIPPAKTKWDRCEVCGMELKGYKWRVAPGKYVCHRCRNE